MLTILVVVILVLLLFGGLPQLGAAPAGWGYYPSGIMAVALLILLILFLMGRL